MTHIGRYEVHAELGHGGMGVVYLARDPALDRDLAIKVLTPELSSDPTALQRFLDEARNAARLSHPNVVQMYDAGESDGRWYFAMEFVPGTDLGKQIEAHGPYSLAETVALLKPVAAGLDHAHAAGLVHRDIKPANILVSLGGTPKLADFGISRVGNSRGLTMTGAAMGTPDYMSPEQATGSAVDYRSDLYSLAVVAYALLAGQPPFEGDSAVSIALAHVSKAPPPIAARRSDLPRHVDAVLARGLAKDPGARYASATLFVDALLSGVGGLTAPAPLAAAPTAAAGPSIQPTMVLAAAALLLGLALVIAGHNAGGARTGSGPSPGTTFSGPVAPPKQAPPPDAQAPAPGAGTPKSAPESEPKPQHASSSYILPVSNERELTESDLNGLDAHNLRLARNEIYARHGSLFHTSYLQEYFDQQPWYHRGSVYAEDVDLSDLETRNAKFILSRENR